VPWTESNLFYPAGRLADARHSVVVDPATVGMAFVGLKVFRLGPNEHRVLTTGVDEAIVLPLSGACRVEADGKTFDLVGRPSVFEAISDFAYLPIRCEARITSEHGGEFAVPTSRATERLEPAYGSARDISIELRGAGAATRQVTNFFTPEAFEADKLISVEVLTPAGNFSSYPPHKHDEFKPSCGEAIIEEIYYFRFQGENGYGLYRQYASDGEFDIKSVVRDGDVYLIPRGYHGPSAAVPGHHMYFLNVLAGPSEERTMCYCDDPSQHWVRESWKGQQPDPRLPLTGIVDPNWRSKQKLERGR
jgi:5-deoxy-glucuronate isomerase